MKIDEEDNGNGEDGIERIIMMVGRKKGRRCSEKIMMEYNDNDGNNEEI